ncbi:MAG: hypothetical protein KAH18_08730 [Psychromonas sp.]|nr:hypothetical protein [Psychromonas sp.]
MSSDFKSHKQQSPDEQDNSQFRNEKPKRSGVNLRGLFIWLLPVVVAALVFHYLVSPKLLKEIPAITHLYHIEKSASHLKTAENKALHYVAKPIQMTKKAIETNGVTDQDKSTRHDKKLIGGDKDEHGCYRSAGYAWCHSTNQCERPWILAKKVGFDNSEVAFKQYCHN